MAVEYFNSCDDPFGALERMSGMSGGPATIPPAAVTALIITPERLAAACHWLHAEQIAEQVPSINDVNLSDNSRAASQWYLLVEAATKRAGGTRGGIHVSSPG